MTWQLHIGLVPLSQTTASAARGLANAPAPLILLLTEPDPGLARSLAGRGPSCAAGIWRATGPVEVKSTFSRAPSREGIASALTAAGIAKAAG